MMDGVGPWPERPRVAVATSGGADSLALTLLAARWATGRGGRADALIVDHGLRPDATAEARTVAGWLAARAIPCRVLRWRGPKPDAGIQAAARQARYALLEDWCRANAVLDLLVGHTADDQAETVLLRLSHGTGPDGLAGMSALAERHGVRLVRPLLGVARSATRATLDAAGQPWIEDPSNDNPRFERVRIRRWLAAAPRGLAAGALAAAATDLGRVRAGRDAALAAHLARSVALDPRGHARIDRRRFGAANDSIGAAALARLARTFGAADHVRRSALEPVWRAIRDGTLGAGRTVGGCRFVTAGRTVLVCREAGRLVEVASFDGRPTLWDRRFTLALAGARRLRSRLTIRALGNVPAARLPTAAAAVPALVRAAWPALWRGDRLAAVPHLGYTDPDFATLLRSLTVRWTPAAPVASATFAVVTSPKRII